MSGSDGLSPSAREFLLALRDGPLDVHQLAADLAAPREAVTNLLEVLIHAGLVHAVTVESGRQAWGLTVRGRWRIAAGGEP